MYDAPTAIRHPETSKADDAALAQASRSHVADNGALQLIAELFLKLRAARFSWWTPEILRGTWSASERMAWFGQRPDIRQRITSSLTGLKPKAARGKQPDYQGALIDSVLDDGDTAVEDFENAFDAIELAAYAPVAAIWHRFRERMPWDEDTPPNQELTAWLFERLLASSSTIEGMTRKPILTPHAIRATIPGRIWHAKLPLEVRVAIDEQRLQREQARPGEPFHAADDLSVATPAIIAANIPLRDLLCVLDAAERAMGLPSSTGLSAAPAPPPRVEQAAAPRTEPPKAELPRAEPLRAEPKVEVSAPEKPAAKPAPGEKPAPAEKPAERHAPRWERMAKVFEKVGKDGDTAESKEDTRHP